MPAIVYAVVLSVLVYCDALAEPCPQPHELGSGETLTSLSEFYLGDAKLWPAILLATNSRVPEFRFISDPQDIHDVPAVCILDVTEATVLAARLAKYERAITEAMRPQRTSVDSSLVTFPEDSPVTLVTWVRDAEVVTYRDHAPKDLWVTVEPSLRTFCSQYLRGHNLDETVLRLEQHLGLPPSAAKTTFVRIRLPNPGPTTIFRPCSDPSTTHADCETSPPNEKRNPKFANWFFHQFYFSYGQAKPVSYPWTAMGYTFDWATSVGDNEFGTRGESEFVIPAGTKIEVLGTETTGQYCSNGREVVGSTVGSASLGTR